MFWASIEQQEAPLEYSRIKLTRNRKNNSFAGTTDNVHLLKILLKVIAANTPVKFSLDGSPDISYTTVTENDSIYLKKENNQWVKAGAPGSTEKNSLRNGTFKDAFNHRMVFVYGTTGNAEENQWSVNKARFDAETWYYRGTKTSDTESSVKIRRIESVSRSAHESVRTFAGAPGCIGIVSVTTISSNSAKRRGSPRRCRRTRRAWRRHRRSAHPRP